MPRIDLRAFERQLTVIEKKALPAAQAGYLNALAFGARKNLQTAFSKEISGGPMPFTQRGVVVDKATASGKPEAAVKLLPEQARYLQYPILGGVRRADPGASPWDVFTGAAETNPYGNVKKGYVKRIGKKAKTERDPRERSSCQVADIAQRLRADHPAARRDDRRRRPVRRPLRDRRD